MENVRNQVTLKSLQTRLEKVKAEMSVTQIQMNELKTKMQGYSKKYTELKKEIEDHTKDILVLSEHAKLRYLERIELISPDDVEAKVITDALKLMWKTLGSGTFPLGDSEHSVIIKGNIITTIT